MTSPPSELPQAIVRVGTATWAAKTSMTANWSATASSTAMPVDVYDEPANAKPSSTRRTRVTGSGATSAGFGRPGGTRPWP